LCARVGIRPAHVEQHVARLDARRELLTQPWIAIRIEDGRLRADQGAVAVQRQRGALRDERRPKRARASPPEDSLREGGIVAMDLPVAPAVEVPGGAGEAALAVEEEGRPRIADPQVVDIDLEVLDARPAQPLGVRALVRTHTHHDGLELCDRLRHTGDVPPHVGEECAPQRFVNRPRHPASAMGRRFRRHPPAGGGRLLRVSRRVGARSAQGQHRRGGRERHRRCQERASGHLVHRRVHPWSSAGHCGGFISSAVRYPSWLRSISSKFDLSLRSRSGISSADNRPSSLRSSRSNRASVRPPGSGL
jgi:hypothetical protein